MSEKRHMPVLMVKPGTVSKKDIELARNLGFILIIECSEPEAARFVEPPIPANMDDQTRACVDLFRYIIDCGGRDTTLYRADLVARWVRALMQGKRPESVPKTAKATGANHG
jgi:hypothetical protein